MSTLLLFSLPFVVQMLSHVWLFVTPWTAACQVPLPFTISWSLIKFVSTGSVMLSNRLILCCSLLLLLQSLPASGSFPMSWLFASGGPSIKLSHPFHHSGHREKISIYKLGSRPGLLDTESSGTSILEILVSRTERNKCLFLKSSSLCCGSMNRLRQHSREWDKDLQITYLISLVSVLCEEFFYFSNKRQIFFKMNEGVEYTFL